MAKKNGFGVAGLKQFRISQAQKYTLIEVLVTSLILGLAIVLSIYLFKYIVFNTKVITAKGEAERNYELSVLNIGICKDADRDGKISDQELNNCDPNKVNVDDVKGSLRYNVIANMSQNQSLESVARDSLPDCYDENKKKIDFLERYQNATDNEDRDKNFNLMKMCSALRVIPDALPAQKNEEATLASLNQIFLISNWEPESLSPNNNTTTTDAEGTNEKLGTVPYNISIEADNATTFRVLSNIERSIREFATTTATIEWSSSNTIKLNSVAKSYYAPVVTARESTATIDAKGKITKKAITTEGESK